MAEQRKGDHGEVVAGPGLVQQRAEQHEQEDEGRRHAQPDAEHAFLAQPQVRHRLGEGCAFPGDHVGRQMAEEHIGQEQQRHQQQRRAERTAGRFQQTDHPDAGGDEVGQDRQARPVGKREGEDRYVTGRKSADYCKGPVLGRNAVARRTFQGGKGQKSQEDREGQMDRPRVGIVHQRDVVRQHVRQRRGDPELEQRPGHRHINQHIAREMARRRACARIRLRDEILYRFFG